MSENGHKSNGTPEKQEGSSNGFPSVAHQFKPGQSGNPGGRAKGSGLTDRIRKLLNENEGAGAEAFIAKAYELACEGDFRFWKEIMDRMDGPIKQQMEASITTAMKAIDRESFRGV